MVKHLGAGPVPRTRGRRTRVAPGQSVGRFGGRRRADSDVPLQPGTYGFGPERSTPTPN
jgi:hypothetical protein